MNILGIETSCDDTSSAVVNDSREILSHVTYSQTAEHAPYAGVVPEIAARSHVSHIDNIIKNVMSNASLKFRELDAVAVTAGPGLIGGVIVGVMTAKAIASVHQLPIIGVNHLEGHALSARLDNDIDFPFLLLLVSGGHCQILLVEGVGRYRKIGETLDDALGEAFDKVAKMMRLGYPGGPKIEQYALKGDENAYNLPIPFKGKPHCNFSFSGLKTAVRSVISNERSDARNLHHANEASKSNVNAPLRNEIISNISASFQKTALLTLQDRLKNAFLEIEKEGLDIKNFVVAGGVAANKYLRHGITNFAYEFGYNTFFPPLELCSDNGAMIAWAGIERFRLGMRDDLSLIPKARWDLCSE